MIKRSAVFACAAIFLFAGTSEAAVAAPAAPVPAYELLESVPLKNGRGTLKLWRNMGNGCLHAQVVNAPKGTVATERRDGRIITFKVNSVDGGSASTAETHTRNGDIRGAMFSNGFSTFTRYYSSVSTC